MANNIVELLEKAKADYQSGKYDDAYLAATEAYLAQYEANGLEKATISYIGQSRVSQLEWMHWKPPSMIQAEIICTLCFFKVLVCKAF